MNITIDDQACTCEKGEFLRDVALRYKINIPALCHHNGLAGLGCCRLCLVEVIEKGRSRIVVSCLYPIESECTVLTKSELVKKERGLVLALLHKLAPESEVITALARAYGAPDLPRLQPNVKGGKCILCGLCVKACQELGTGAIATVQRGILKEISTPYGDPSADCVGCGSCANVCPTKAIPVVTTATTRTIWGREFNLRFCAECGALLDTEEAVAWAAQRADQQVETLCESCRRQKIAAVLAPIYSK
jgi:NADH dehydrogenase/NADH:ubiquinone oxidoreductase subunit G